MTPSLRQKQKTALSGIDPAKYGFHDDIKPLYETDYGLTEDVVRDISDRKGEPKWMLDLRLKSLKHFLSRPTPTWGGNLAQIDFGKIKYYVKPSERAEKSWDDVPDEIKRTFDRLGIPEAERKFLGGVGAQYDSEVVYHKIREDLEKLGVIFLGMDDGLKEYPEIVKKYFTTVIPYNDNKFAALNTAVWSGGSFVYVPKGIDVKVPLQAYFRINTEKAGQFERTLIIAEPGAKVHYIEGCFTKGAPVITSGGIKAVEDVQIGDLVLTHNTRYRRVYHTQARQHKGKLYKIEYFGDSSQKIEVTDEHPFLSVKRQKNEYKNLEWKTEWVKADELKKGDYIAIPIDRTVGEKDEREFQIKVGKGRHGFKEEILRLDTDKNFFRLIGYYLSEGSIVGGHYLHFTFNEKETPYIKDVKELLEKYFGKKACEQKPYKHGISLVLSSTKAVRFFESQFGKGAFGKRMPEWVLKESAEKQKELIKAFWRGDGSFMMQQYSWGIKRMFRMNTISKNIAYGLRDILLRLNVFGSINLQKRSGKRKDMYCVYVGGSFLGKFAEIVEAYPSNEVAVGNQIAFQQLQQINAKSYAHISGSYAFVPIKRIVSREVENVPVYNFSVEEDESYIANGVVVHNCTAPVYATDSLHSAVVELIALEGSKIRYTTIQNWSKNVFNLVTKRAFAYRNSTVEWVDGNLGCLTGETKIFLNNEVKDIKDAEPNDVIFSMNQNFELERARILAKKFSGRKEIFKLRALNHREINATANHPFLALKKIGKQRLLKWVPLEQLKSGDLVAISGKMPDHGQPYKIKFAQREGRNAPRKIKVPIDSDKNLMWLLGFYLGDGYFDRNRVYFAVPPQDKSYHRVKDLIESIFGAQAAPYKSTLRVNSVALIQLVKELGFAGNARTKRVPTWVFTLPEDQKRSFIDGYIAADGHIRKNHKNVSITSCSRELLEQVKTLAISCGLNPMKISKWSRVEKKKLGKETKEYTHYFLYFGEQEAQTPVQFIPIAEITPNGYADTYDIEIEGTHNFVANGFLVHNSKLTMKYPSIYLKEPGAKAEILSVAFAGKDQHQDAGGKVVHMAPNTTSTITSKSISKDNGRTTYRGLVKVYPNATNVRSHVKCDALMLDKDSRSDTIPYMEIDEKRGVTIAHEATVGKISEEHLFYLMSRGLNEQEAMTMVVMGFFQAFVKELPLDYAVELNKLIQLEMEGAIG